MHKSITVIILFALLLLVGTFGYMYSEGIDFWNSMYLTVITITTVGYGDMVPKHASGKILTAVLIFCGGGVVMYTFSKITETVIEGRIRDIFERNKMDKKVMQLSKHHIVCGFGRIGKEICQVLAANKKTFVIIENNEEVIQEIEKLNYIFIKGEAADDEVLLKAKVEKAASLIAVVSSDADNLFITLSARVLNPKLFIMARSSGAPGADIKLHRAGATKVISPYNIGARRMAQLLIRPTVIDFIDLTMHAGELGLRMEELLVTEKASFANKNLIESGIRNKFDVIVVAIKRQAGEMSFNPGPKTMIQPGDILVVLGEHNQIIALENEVQ